MKAFSLLSLLALPFATLAQAPGVGIGTTAPDASAVLDLTSTSQGILVPRLTEIQRQAIASPAAGLLVYQRDGAQPGFWYFASGGGWTFFNPSADNLGNHTAQQNLNLQGNALVGTGASIGTTVGVGVRADGGLNLGQNTAGTNIFLGYQAGQATVYDAGNGLGGNNHFSGYQSGSSNTTGSENQFSGNQSGYHNTTGGINYFSGYQSGYNNIGGNQNQFSGFRSGYNNIGSLNYFSGYESGYNNTTGVRNQFSGFRSGYANTTGNYNQFSGFQSGLNNTTGNYNQFSGYESGRTTNTGSFNQFSGYESGYNNTGGTRNQFSGYQSGYSNTIGSNNQFSGYQSGYSNTTGAQNLFSGYQSGYSNTTGNNNVFDGRQSGYANTTGSDNLFSGSLSGYANTTGSINTFIGITSGLENTTGNSNVFNGGHSGSANTTGSNNTALGSYAGPTTGNLTNATAIGANAVVSQSNSLVLGNRANVGIGTSAPDVPLDVQGLGDATVSSFAFYARGSNGQPTSGGASGYLTNISIRASGRVVALEFNATSDARLKTILGRTDNAADLGLLTRLRITDYQLRDRAQFGERRFKKVIAQEVEQVFPQAVSRQTGFLPDIYAQPTAMQPQGDSLLVLTLPASLPEGAAAGQRLKLVGPAGEVLARVARPAAPGTRTLVVRGAPSAATGPLFVFGLEHPDVRAVDYEALAMLNVSATQELARRVAALEAANAALHQQATAAAAHTTTDHADLQTLKAQVARLLGETAVVRFPVR